MTARQLRAQLRDALFLSALCAGALAMVSSGLILLLTGGSLRPLLVRRDYTAVVKLNWDLALPESWEEVYKADSSPSFHGDGMRYHVLQYAVGSGIESALAWQAPPVDVSEAEAMETLMDGLDVPDRLRPDLESCRWHTAVDPSDSRDHLYLLFDPSTLELYILEFFC
ncbi:hypothetical protein [uncultured Oscillibacter sp.]|uniref:hypothetical protein n=1 Tax=uncultured Oscillibacter sp. TaxID=876091 RepID=UPI00280B56A4|nr:hypothetical protein [uncultured Oscillibacter sp.]